MIHRRQLMQAAGASFLFGTGALAADSKALAYQWRSMPFGGGALVDGFAFHPKEPGLLYARTERGGAYRWGAEAKSWTPLLDHLDASEGELMSVLSLALDPSDPQRVYLACGYGTAEWSRKAALLVSADRGATWQRRDLDLRLGGDEAGRGSGERLQVDPQQGEVLLLGTTRDGLLRSSDRGKSFKRLSFAGQQISLVLFAPGRRTLATNCKCVGDQCKCAAPERRPLGTPSKTVYVGCQDKPGLYASHDGGQTFALEDGAPQQVPQHAAVGPDGTLYVSFAAGQGDQVPNPGNAREGSVWKRSPAGQWSDITPQKPSGRGYGYSALDVDREGRIVTSMLVERWDGDGDELFLSSDGGAHWTALSDRSQHDTKTHPWLVGGYVQNAQAMGRGIADAKFDPFDTEHLIYGTEYGVWATNNLGLAHKPAGKVRWDFAVDSMELATAQSLVSPSGGVLLFAAMGDELAGAAWEQATKMPVAGLFLPRRESTRCVDAAWLASQVVARTVEAGTGGHVSLDGGATWRAFAPAPNTKDARGGHVAVSTKGSSMVWAPSRQVALYSRDRGRSWDVCKGWPETRDTDLVPVADKAIDGVYYVYDVISGSISISIDGGESFKPNMLGLPKLNPTYQNAQLVAAPGKVRDLWITTPEGLIHVPGLEERAITIRKVSWARFVALGKAAPGASYHSVYVWGVVGIGNAAPLQGLFRSDDAGASFRRIDDDSHRYGILESLAADPLEHGTVYLGPRGRGVIIGSPRA